MPPFGFVLPGDPERKVNFAGRGAAFGILAEWLRRLIRNQLGTFPREFESLRCRLLFFFIFFESLAVISNRWQCLLGFPAIFDESLSAFAIVVGFFPHKEKNGN